MWPQTRVQHDYNWAKRRKDLQMEDGHYLAENFPGLGTAPERFAKNVALMSQGQLEVKVFGAGELVPALEVFDAVSGGTAEMGHGAGYYWKGKAPEAQFFTTVPFGMTAQEMNGWIHHGGGQALWEEVYAKFGLVPLAAGNTGVQMGGWFNKEINSVADLKGLKMRILAWAVRSSNASEGCQSCSQEVSFSPHCRLGLSTLRGVAPLQRPRVWTA